MDNSTRTGQPSQRLKNTPLPPSSLQNLAIINDLPETNLYSLFESSSDVIFLLDEGKIVGCNNKTLEIFACNREQIMNQSLLKYLPLQQLDNSDSQ